MSELRRQWVGPAMVLWGAGWFGCSRGHAPSEAQSQPVVPSAAISGETPAPAFTSNAPLVMNTSAVPRSPRLDDARWQRAMGEDLADKQALADALGATGLLEALDDGGDITTTALLALPLADDAELALGPLAKRLGMATTRDAFLLALLHIAGRPAKARETLDPEGAREAGEALLTLAKDISLPREHRALAISACRALAEKKIVDPSKIPADLDPP